MGTHPPHFSPNAINADLSLSSPSDANSYKIARTTGFTSQSFLFLCKSLESIYHNQCCTKHPWSPPPTPGQHNCQSGFAFLVPSRGTSESWNCSQDASHSGPRTLENFIRGAKCFSSGPLRPHFTTDRNKRSPQFLPRLNYDSTFECNGSNETHLPGRESRQV